MATNFEMFAGDTREVVVSITDENGVKVDLTTGTVLWQLAAADWLATGGAALVSKTSEDGQITLADGSFTVHLLSADTMGLNGVYYHEAQVTLVDGTVATPITGRVKVKPNIIDPR